MGSQITLAATAPGGGSTGDDTITGTLNADTIIGY